MQTVTVYGPSGKPVAMGLIQEDYEAQTIGRGVPVYVSVYDARYIDYIIDWIKERINRKYDVVIEYTGERRVGKSTLVIQIARRIDPEFSVDNIVFRLEDFRARLSSNPRADPDKGIYPQVILDEAGSAMYKGDWATRVQRQMVKNFQVMGEKRQITHLVLPHADFLNSKVQDGVAQVWIDVTEYRKERGFFEVREGIRNKWELKRYWTPWAAAFFDPIPETDDFWTQYLARKQSFIDEELANQELTEDSDTPRPKANAQRDKAIALVRKTTQLSHREIAQRLSMSDKTVSRILKGIESK